MVNFPRILLAVYSKHPQCFDGGGCSSEGFLSQRQAIEECCMALPSAEDDAALSGTAAGFGAPTAKFDAADGAFGGRL